MYTNKSKFIQWMCILKICVKVFFFLSTECSKINIIEIFLSITHQVLAVKTGFLPKAALWGATTLCLYGWYVFPSDPVGVSSTLHMNLLLVPLWRLQSCVERYAHAERKQLFLSAGPHCLLIHKTHHTLFFTAAKWGWAWETNTPVVEKL